MSDEKCQRDSCRGGGDNKGNGKHENGKLTRNNLNLLNVKGIDEFSEEQYIKRQKNLNYRIKNCKNMIKKLIL